MFLATTVTEDEEYILGELAPSTSAPPLFVVSDPNCVECLKKCLVRVAVYSLSLRLDQKMDFPSEQLNTCCIKNGLISKLLLND